MNRTGLISVLCAFAFLVSGSVGAATVFAPTDGDVNFFDLYLVSGSMVAMFDDSDTSYVGSFLDLPLPEVVTFTAGGISSGDYTATNESFTTLNLTGSNQFIMGISHDGGATWSAETLISPRGTNAFDIYFGDGSILAVDARVVPLPAAVWLFGSGLLGLVGMA